ncbi:hypothetical protein P3S68_008896 [Capsicum galapagoense]
MAHASVASLMRTIESLLTSNSPMRSLICDHREELCALREKVKMTDFKLEVKEIARAAEYTIQLRLTVTVLNENKCIIRIIGSIFFKGISNIWTRRKFRKSLQQLEKDIDHVWKESTKIQDKGKQVSEESLVHDFSSSTNDILNVKSNMVGRVLGLSYNHLTSDLKACLLHFGIFPEDSEIPVKNLMRSWMAEGFLKLENDLEGEAEKCLQELVDRCLVLVCKKSLDGTKIRSCYKELGICGCETDSKSIWDSGLPHHLVNLQQLETLSFIHCFELFPASAKAFPATLKKLKLERTFLHWTYMDIIAELPNLEVLKLMDYACRGEEWHPNFTGFTLLKIPIEFADIHSLQLIVLDQCPPALGESAVRIQQEQEELGNDPVDVRIPRPFDTRVRRLELIPSMVGFFKQLLGKRKQEHAIGFYSI